MRRYRLRFVHELAVLLRHYVGLFGIFRGSVLLLDRLTHRSLFASAYEKLSRSTWRRNWGRTRDNFYRSIAPFHDRDSNWFSTYFPDEYEQKRAAAQTIVDHNFDFLGTGLRYWGDPIDWHQDAKSGCRWPMGFYTAYGSSLTPGIDIKIPWELSRCHHLVTLAQAWRLTRDDRYARECFDQWESWLGANPWGYGINWASTMEVAIRAVNWLWGFSLLSNAPGWTSDRSSRLYRSLWQHGIHIEHNLEVGVSDGQIVTANHYLANVCGLACIGLFCPELPSASRWRRVGLRAIKIFYFVG